MKVYMVLVIIKQYHLTHSKKHQNILTYPQHLLKGKLKLIMII